MKSTAHEAPPVAYFALYLNISLFELVESGLVGNTGLIQGTQAQFNCPPQLERFGLYPHIYGIVVTNNNGFWVR